MSEKEAMALIGNASNDPYILSQVEDTFSKEQVKQICEFFREEPGVKLHAEKAKPPKYNYMGWGLSLWVG
jgi:hypothetical protein